MVSVLSTSLWQILFFITKWYIFVHVYDEVGNRGQLSMPFLRHCPPYLMRKDLLLEFWLAGTLLCRSGSCSPSLWVHVCHRAVKSCTTVFLGHPLSSSCIIKKSPEPCGDSVGYRLFVAEQSTVSHSLHTDQFLLCINLHLLQKAASLKRVERLNNLWVQKNLGTVLSYAMGFLEFLMYCGY